MWAPDSVAGRCAKAETRVTRCIRWLAIALWLPASAAWAQTDDDARGRDFPKTLTLDEPGIDDEISLPTWTHIAYQAAPGLAANTENDFGVEIDKRITASLEIQLNAGYRMQNDAGGADRYGWDNASFTTKYVLLNRPATETILTAGLVREFGGTGALGVGAGTVSTTTPTFYIGQGMGAAHVPDWLRAFAITGTLGYRLPDQARGPGGKATPVLQPAASLQYSLHYLAPWLARRGLPAITQRLVLVTELTYAMPTTAGAPAAERIGLASPGLFYAGDGYQLGLEAPLPLTRASGSGVGIIAQLNVSFRRLGLGAISGTLW